MDISLNSSLAVLSAMLTPAVLISACSSLLIATSNRLGRVIDRTRTVSERFEEAMKEGVDEAMLEEERRLLFSQLDRTARRSRLLQRAMSRLYIALAVFVATSMAIGAIYISGQQLAWAPLGLGMVGAGFLFSASVLLIVESRVALSSVDDEMDFVIRMSREHAPRELLDDPVQRRWFRRR